jgi:hypothetical protein
VIGEPAMTRRAELVIRHRSPFTWAATEEHITLTAPRTRYAALLWPRDEDVSSLFRIAMLPIRIVPVALLWATSRPGRLLVAVVVAVTSAVELTH